MECVLLNLMVVIFIRDYYDWILFYLVVVKGLEECVEYILEMYLGSLNVIDKY